MGDKDTGDMTGTYVFDEDVLDEMENFDATAVLEDAWESSADYERPDDGLLDDIESSSVVLDGRPVAKKS